MLLVIGSPDQYHHFFSWKCGNVREARGKENWYTRGWWLVRTRKQSSRCDICSCTTTFWFVPGCPKHQTTLVSTYLSGTFLFLTFSSLSRMILVSSGSRVKRVKIKKHLLADCTGELGYTQAWDYQVKRLWHFLLHNHNGESNIQIRTDMRLNNFYIFSHMNITDK